MQKAENDFSYNIIDPLKFTQILEGGHWSHTIREYKPISRCTFVIYTYVTIHQH